MTLSYSDEFRTTGMVRVEAAIDPAFCESVVSRRLAAAGIDENDPSTWPTAPLHMSVESSYPLAEIAPSAADALDALVGLPAVAWGDIPDNLIVNFPTKDAHWWGPEEGSAHADDGWHKDGDWFRHFLDSPEQALLVIVFWRDVGERQGATYFALDSVAPVARLLADHPEGLEPSRLADPVRQIIRGCTSFEEMVGTQGTVVFAHPFMLHTRSTNRVGPLRIISNSSVMLREPMRFDRPEGLSVVERSILDALGLDALAFRPSGARGKVESDRARRWRAGAR